MPDIEEDTEALKQQDQAAEIESAEEIMIAEGSPVEPGPDPDAVPLASPGAAEMIAEGSPVKVPPAAAMTTDDVLSTGETNAAPAGLQETERAHMKAIIEAVTYITDEPLTSQQICAALQQPIDVVQGLLDELLADYAKPERGLSIREVAGGFKMATKPEHHEAIRTFVKNLKPPLKLSLAALETLAVIAYKQPITAPEIMEIRGVAGAGVLKTLLDRKLIATAGRKNVVGKPILYKTTKDFLVQFGLKDLAELPTLKEFEELGRLAIHDADLYEESKSIAAASEKPVEPAEPAAKEE